MKSVYEIVLNGIDEPSIHLAMKTGIEAATETGTVMYIGASHFDGKLGQYPFLSTTFTGNLLLCPAPKDTTKIDMNIKEPKAICDICLVGSKFRFLKDGRSRLNSNSFSLLSILYPSFLSYFPVFIFLWLKNPINCSFKKALY